MTSLLLAEWTKIRSVRSTPWTLLPTMAFIPALAYLSGRGFATSLDERPTAFDPLFATFYSITLGQLGIVLFGVLAVGAEHSAGTIRASLIAVPQRGKLYLAKAGVLILMLLGISSLVVPLTFFAAQAGLGRYAVTSGGEGVAQAMTGAVLYLILIGLLAAGLTAVLRNSVGALAILLPLLFLGGTGLGNLPKVKEVAQYLPDQAGMLIMHLTAPDDPLQAGRDYAPWTGIAIMALWSFAAILAGLITLHHRDPT